MITLYTFGPAFGLPDPSPFVTKAEVLLKMAGVPYRTDTTGFNKAPKGKLPYIDDGGAIVADSTFIRMHLRGTTASTSTPGCRRPSAASPGPSRRCARIISTGSGCMRAGSWTPISTRARAGSSTMCPLRCGRSSSPWSGARFGAICGGTGWDGIRSPRSRSLQPATSAPSPTSSADKPYLMGEAPSGADATVFPFVRHALCPLFKTPILNGAELQPNLVAYRDRMMRQYYPGPRRGRTARPHETALAARQWRRFRRGPSVTIYGRPEPRRPVLPSTSPLPVHLPPLSASVRHTHGQDH